ncbi:glycosyl hydrolase family 61-domain-containing protein [Immersiella caudata]|uniref:lytic cellulose monooxygenase (C4-dehydrogenating) n=1 Tax=Immersiella caudata TaxID=314043 RepID=A0AA40BZ97_9PEZI|nr:glycosyl hydrolase family 61-domain-containing protein [Immersiella caudata]
MTRSLSLLATAGLASTALAHSFVSYVRINGEQFNGYDPRPGLPNVGHRIVWAHNAPDQGWVNASHYANGDIACHRDAVSVPAHGPVRAGQTVGVHWNGWPRIHVGPVLSYIAPCTGTSDGCASVNKAQLKWTMIDNSAPGLINKEPTTNGTWATDFLIFSGFDDKRRSNNTWQVRLPAGLKPGPYVLRHEIISLHYGTVPEEGGAQHYPICVNLWVLPPTGSTPAPFNLVGVPSGDLYEAGHPGLFYDITARPMADYVLPGPGLAAGATPVIPQEQYEDAWVRDGVPVKVQGTTTVPFFAKRTAGAFRA